MKPPLEIDNVEIFFLYRITHYYYSVIGALTVFIVGIPISLLTRDDKKDKVDRKLLSPIVRWMVPDDKEQVNYYNVEKAIKILSVHNNI